MLRYSFRQRLEGLLVTLKYFDCYCSLGYKVSLTSKSKDSRTSNKRCQRHKPSCVDFAFSFAFENGHRFKNFWH